MRMRLLPCHLVKRECTELGRGLPRPQMMRQRRRRTGVRFPPPKISAGKFKRMAAKRPKTATRVVVGRRRRRRRAVGHARERETNENRNSEPVTCRSLPLPPRSVRPSARPSVRCLLSVSNTPRSVNHEWPKRETRSDRGRRQREQNNNCCSVDAAIAAVDCLKAPPAPAGKRK